ncbi:SpvB/TcaC N-terminal domain-containing protein [Nannocystis bainbridge]|uniref:SpvB/TcaC N-terminal domain-containing protein n=1 Tax=Nannocystis bainbridge TaxID=2995303 RepID=A0ABT5E936_9BACT|nr:SpvB/TcaC N-terminal domain-containing protein [Nannocystis bainbridge]MDC0721963.1 SpvB/TcaC N-terminal domain-containing protein [Nannocystis bainbridge]
MAMKRDNDTSGGRMTNPSATQKSGNQPTESAARPSGHRAGPGPSPAVSSKPQETREASPGAAASAGTGQQNSQSPAPAAPNPSELAPSISLPKGGGALKNIGDKFEANAFSGSGGMSIPIAVSPGRGLAPTLALGYSTGAGNGPFGMGWQLSVASISRKTDKGLPTYDDAAEADTFLISDAEDLVPLLEEDGGEWTRKVFTQEGHRVHAYRPRVEAGFARIERWVHLGTGDVHWRTWSRDNVRSTYGSAPTSRIADPADPARVFTWLIDQTSDDRGNIVRFEYKQEDLDDVDLESLEEHERLAVTQAQAQRYLKRIYYGNATPYVADDWHFEVLLDYGEHDPHGTETGTWPARPDTFSNFRACFDVRTRRLCRRILMLHHFEELPVDPYLVAATELTYSENPTATLLTAARHRGYVYSSGAYSNKTYPPVEFTYSTAQIDPTLRLVDNDTLKDVPGALGGRFELVDLDGEGLPGLLTEQAGHWYYKRNEGNGTFGPLRSLPSLPSNARLGSQRLLDLDGDGALSLASFSGPAPGFYERPLPTCGAAAEDWRPFRSFRAVPNIDLNAPNVQLLDINGDGLADILVCEDNRFIWYPSEGHDGYGEPRVLSRPRDERVGPQLIWTDPQQAIYFTDMTGDGLADIVRVRNGSVVYWPNLGYGRFGRQIGMRGAPVFDRPDRFRADRLRIGDIDGSGTTDLVYVRQDGARLWHNQSGNSFSNAVQVDIPPVDSLSSVQLADILGKGTAALVWSTDLPHRQGTHIAFVDLMSAGKPYLMLSSKNNMGAETRVEYAPSTRFYLEDRAAGRPWKTRLPFPTHVIERVEVRDHVTGHTFVQKYRYHHGYFDGPEREFRGFGMVETEDTESWADYNAPKLFPTGHQIVGEELHSPPVLTRTWYHTGAYLGGTSLAHCYSDEYYSDKTLENPAGIAIDLHETLIPAGLTPVENREAVRALRGRPLRVEVYGLDGSPAQAHPYSVAESNFAVRLLQPRDGDQHAVFLVHDRESLSYHYERDPSEPRVSHSAVLEVDDFGNPVRSVSVAYKKPVLLGSEAEQLVTSVVLTESDLLNVDDQPDSYRLGVPVELRSYELHGLAGDPSDPFTHAELLAHADAATELPYHGLVTPGAKKRLLSRAQVYYYSDNLAARLSLGQCGLRALPYETLTLAFTQAHLDLVFTNGELTGLDLETEGGYREDGGRWWRPSGRVLFDAAHFYRVTESRDIFGNATTFTHDAHSLLIEAAEDALGNTISAHNDYRLLAPDLVTDPNGNRQAVAFDALGMVIKTAVMGKVSDSDGDTLTDPTVEIEYDLTVIPSVVHTIVRENHGAGNLAFQHSYAYSGGLGQVVLQKAQAEPGLAPKRDGSGDLVFDGGDLVFEDTSPNPRWVGNGRVIVDNKGNPVKQYEPFFDSSPAYTDEQELVEWGVTPFIHYDPVGRMIRTDLPDGTFIRVAFTPWQQVAHDANDNVLASDWYAERDALVGGTPHNDGEKYAALHTEPHDGTPTVTLLDNLGRPFLVIADNGLDENDDPLKFETRTNLDIEGNTLEVEDARGNTAETNTFAPGGLQLKTHSLDAGTRLALPNALGAPLRAWDSRDNVRRWTYDVLSRPTHAYLAHAADPEVLQQRIVYGESLGVTADTTNHLGQVYRVYDSAGVLTSVEYDFKGNLLTTERRLAEDYTTAPDWIDLAPETDPALIHAAAAPLLEAETFTTSWTYDALSRVRTQTTPDDSVTTQAFGVGGMLQSVAVNVRGAVAATDIVTNIDYNARGQRLLIAYGNGSSTDYAYDPLNFRVTRIHTTRPNPDPDLRTVQDLRYHYDPSGNIARIRDQAQQGVFFDNAYADPTQSFVYDGLYRLISATGREHATLTMPTAEGFAPIAHPQDIQAQRNYTQRYTYDPVGNILRMKHESGMSVVWERGYAYHLGGNRLQATSDPLDDIDDPLSYTVPYTHDAHGNMTAMPAIPGGLTWDHDDRLQSSDSIGGGTTYYVYDGAGQRVRKVHVNLSGSTSKQRLYFGSWETYREHKNINTTNDLDLERETLHVHDDHGRVCLIETKTVDTGAPVVTPANVARYQYSNHLGTANLELDEDADVISYEEFHPYGTSSYRAANSAIEVSEKRYRYTGQERDEETGLAYHGARYYAPWLARWTASDPIGLGGGMNRYAYVWGNPVRLVDLEGTTPSERGYVERFFDWVLPKSVQVNVNAPSAPPPSDLGGAARRNLGWQSSPERGPHPGDSAWGMGRHQSPPSRHEAIARSLALSPLDAIDAFVNTPHEIGVALDGVNRGDARAAVLGGLGAVTGGLVAAGAGGIMRNIRLPRGLSKGNVSGGKRSADVVPAGVADNAEVKGSGASDPQRATLSKKHPTPAEPKSVTPFSPEKLNRIVAALAKRNPPTRFVQGDAAKASLKKEGAAAMYSPMEGGPGGTVFLRDNPSAPEVVEELIHLGQARSIARQEGQWRNFTYEEVPIVEIEAQRKLIQLGRTLRWTKYEEQITKANLVDWRALARQDKQAAKAGKP